MTPQSRRMKIKCAQNHVRNRTLNYDLMVMYLLFLISYFALVLIYTPQLRAKNH